MSCLSYSTLGALLLPLLLLGAGGHMTSAALRITLEPDLPAEVNSVHTFGLQSSVGQRCFTADYQGMLVSSRTATSVFQCFAEVTN